MSPVETNQLIHRLNDKLELNFTNAAVKAEFWNIVDPKTN
jgi:hypothetical protein